MRSNEELDRALRRTAPYAQYVYVDVVFGEAGVDVLVPHTLRPGHPEQVNYGVVKTTSTCRVYHDGSATRRPWGNGYIVLRSDVDNASVRLLLSVEQDTPIGGQASGVSAGSGGSLPPVALPFLVEHYANGLHKFEIEPWTPIIGGTGGQSGQVYASQSGQSVKVGPLVFVSWRVQLSTLGTITGTAQIKGLLYPSRATANFRARYALSWVNTTTAFVYVLGAQNENTAAIDLLGATAATASLSTALVQANLANTTVIAGSGMYLTDL